MPYVTVITWPNASVEEHYFRDMGDKLDAFKVTVDSAVNSNFGTIAAYEDSSNVLLGHYYDMYHQKADEWIASVNQIQTEFSTFSNELTIRITNCRNEQAKWHSRIGVTHQEWRP